MDIVFPTTQFINKCRMVSCWDDAGGTTNNNRRTPSNYSVYVSDNAGDLGKSTTLAYSVSGNSARYVTTTFSPKKGKNLRLVVNSVGDSRPLGSSGPTNSMLIQNFDVYSLNAKKIDPGYPISFYNSGGARCTVDGNAAWRSWDKALPDALKSVLWDSKRTDRNDAPEDARLNLNAPATAASLKVTLGSAFLVSKAGVMFNDTNTGSGWAAVTTVQYSTDDVTYSAPVAAAVNGQAYYAPLNAKAKYLKYNFVSSSNGNGLLIRGLPIYGAPTL